MDPIPREYAPGSCNISREEGGLRLATGWMGLGLTLAAGLALLALHVSPLVRLLIFVPAVFSALGFLQAGNRFCVNYGFRGVFNVSGDVGLTAPVPAAAVQKDKLQAWKLVGLASAIAAVVTAVVALVP